MNTKTDLDEQLRELALTDWPAFVALLGKKSIQRAKICLLRQQDKSQRFIARKLNTPKSNIGRACKLCPDKRSANIDNQ